MCVCVFVCVFVCLCVCLLVCLLVCLFVCLFVCEMLKKHVASTTEQSVVVVGGHDGTKSLDDVWELDLTTMTWRNPQISGMV